MAAGWLTACAWRKQLQEQLTHACGLPFSPPCCGLHGGSWSVEGKKCPQCMLGKTPFPSLQLWSPSLSTLHGQEVSLGFCGADLVLQCVCEWGVEGESKLFLKCIGGQKFLQCVLGGSFPFLATLGSFSFLFLLLYGGDGYPWDSVAQAWMIQCMYVRKSLNFFQSELGWERNVCPFYLILSLFFYLLSSFPFSLQFFPIIAPQLLSIK